MSDTHDDESGSRLLKAVETIAIHPKDAKALVSQYRRRSREERPNASEAEHQEIVAEAIIARYAKLAATSGGATALAGVVPGLGTAAAMLGGGLADAAVSMKLQVDMTMCLAETFGWDLNTEDARHLAFLIAAGGALEKAGSEVATRVASKAGVSMLRQYLRGAALHAVKELFKRLGIVFTRKALEKAIPFGVGVIVGVSANYALTKYVGATAKRWFILDREETSSKSPRVRLALPAEQRALEALQRRSSLQNPGDRDALLAHPEAIELPLEQITRGEVFVVEAEGVIKGFAAILPRDGGDVELDGLFVEPTAWRRGYGKILVAHCAEVARAQGAKALYVIGNHHAARFYDACGFEVLGTEATRFGSGLRMRKALT